ncbi:hypothetical protein JKP88DRAFT_291046 [Tribonema minus]|uniref:Uncharacterized protein n=1 Tax=Tribonema minus TaxID=303371 RepID=A0A835YSB7_9STRA|nr:hypothetical protein JKP88DRAFT_291046 [Tribonema minus]
MHQGEREARRGFVQLPGGGGIASLYDCAGAWVQLGWGNVWGAGRRRRRMQQAYNHISAYVIESGISVVATAAVAQLTLATSLQLSAADESATTAGVVLNLSLTVLALMSTYIGRREMQSFFRKGMRPRPAVVMTMVVTIFASATAALMLLVEELSARASNPNGAQSLVRWLHGDAGGYLIVGVTAMRFEARYSEAAYALVWFNFVLAILGTAAICVAIALSPPDDDDEDDTGTSRSKAAAAGGGGVAAREAAAAAEPLVLAEEAQQQQQQQQQQKEKGLRAPGSPAASDASYASCKAQMSPGLDREHQAQLASSGRTEAVRLVGPVS